MEPTDRELVERLAGGDREALAPLMERHRTRLYRIILSYVRDPDEAQDGVQEVFVKAYLHAARWSAGSDARAWLTRIAVNEAIDRYRRRKRQQASFSPIDADPPCTAGTHDPEALVRGRENRDRLRAALQGLPEPHRAVFTLRHHHELSLDEIAQALDMRLGTVKSCLHRAVRRLRRDLIGDGQ